MTHVYMQCWFANDQINIVNMFYFFPQGDIQLRPTAVHPHVLGERGGQVPSRRLPVRKVEVGYQPGGGGRGSQHRQLRRTWQPHPSRKPWGG